MYSQYPQKPWMMQGFALLRRVQAEHDDPEAVVEKEKAPLQLIGDIQPMLGRRLHPHPLRLGFGGTYKNVGY